MGERRILVVDDDPLTAYPLKEHLGHQGYAVMVAEGCQEAREALRGLLRIDLIILDYLLSDGHGTDIFYSMAEDTNLQKPQVIISSCIIDQASPSWEALRMRLPEGSRSLIKAYVNKPYTFDAMDAVVNLLLGASNPKQVHSGDYVPLLPSSSSQELPALKSPHHL